MPTDIRTGNRNHGFTVLAASRLFDPLALPLSQSPAPALFVLPCLLLSISCAGLSSGNMADVESPKTQHLHQPSSKKLELSKTMTLASGRGIIGSGSNKGIACLCARQSYCVKIQNTHFGAMRDKPGSELIVFVNLKGLLYSCIWELLFERLSLPIFFHQLPLNTPIHERSIGRGGSGRLSHLSLQVQSQFLFPRTRPGAAPEI
jgi:hypothetical protein